MENEREVNRLHELNGHIERQVTLIRRGSNAEKRLNVIVLCYKEIQQVIDGINKD